MKEDLTKYCTGCGLFHPRSNFYLRSNGQLVSRCKGCSKLLAKLAHNVRTSQTKTAIVARVRRWRAEHPGKAKALGMRLARRPEYREKMRPSARAHDAVGRAIKRGQLTRPDFCEQCGAGGRIEAAHGDYSKPLKVRWLCVTCHRRWDRDDPKLKDQAKPAW